jgi:hypothetical protein
LHEDLQIGGHGGFELEPDDRPAPAALEHCLKLAHEVFCLFLDLDLGITDDAEGALALERVTGKEPPDEEAGRLFERDDARSRGAFARRQPNEAVDLAGNPDERIQGLPIADPDERQRDGEAQVGNERKRVGRINRKRREQGKDLAQEMILQPRLLLFSQIRAIDQHDAIIREQLPQLTPALLLVACQNSNRIRDAGELLGGGEPVWAPDADPRAQLPLEAGHPDHEEFIEIVGGDGEKPDPFQQRMRLVSGFLEHTTIELEPGQLTVDEAVRTRGKLELGGNRRSRLRKRVWGNFLFSDNSLAYLGHDGHPAKRRL